MEKRLNIPEATSSEVSCIRICPGNKVGFFTPWYLGRSLLVKTSTQLYCVGTTPSVEIPVESPVDTTVDSESSSAVEIGRRIDRLPKNFLNEKIHREVGIRLSTLTA